METLNKKTLSLPSKVFTQFVTAMIIIVGLSACGNKDGSTAVVPPAIVGIEGCSNCGAIISPVAITTFNSESLYMAQWPVQMVNMTVYGSGTTYVPGTSSTYNLYTGNVSVQGTLVVQQQIVSNNGACIVPPASYAVQTYSMGSISLGNNFLVPDLIAGPMRLRMIGASYLGGGSMLVNESGAIRWKGTLEIVSVNGISCAGGLFSYMK